MRKFGVCLALTGATVWLAGCGSGGSSSSSSSARGGIAVVDLDRVAAETGKSVEMKELYDLQENSYKQALVTFQAKATAELQSKLKDLKDVEDKGEKVTDDAKKEVVQFRANASNLLTQAQNEAGAKLGQFKQNQISKFRGELKPVLQEVAAKRGLSIVIPKNEGLLLAVDPGVDITEDVIKAYRDKKPAPTAAAPSAPAAKSSETAAKPLARTAAKDTEDAKN